jgi:hypothetical protein
LTIPRRGPRTRVSVSQFAVVVVVGQGCDVRRV